MSLANARCNEIDAKRGNSKAGVACSRPEVVMGRCVKHAERFRDDKLDDIEQLEEFVRRMTVLIRRAKRAAKRGKRKRRR